MNALKTAAPVFVPPAERPMAREPLSYRMLMVGVHGSGKYSLHHQFIYSCFPKLRDPFFDTEATQMLWKAPEILDLTFRIDLTRMNISRPGTPSSMVSEHLYPDFRLPIDMFRFADNQGMILVYSITSRSSFAALEAFVEARIRERRSGLVEPKVLCLVGNKLDYSRSGRKILCIEAEELAAKIGCPFIECSAKDGKDLDKVRNAAVKVMETQRQQLLKNGQDAQKKSRATSVKSSSLLRRLSDMGRSDSHHSSSSTERDGPVASADFPPQQSTSGTTRWKHAAGLTSPTNQSGTLSFSQLGQRGPKTRTLFTEDRIDEEDESTEESRSSSQQSSDLSTGSGITVTPPSNPSQINLFQHRPPPNRALSRSVSGTRLSTKLPPTGAYTLPTPQNTPITLEANEAFNRAESALIRSQSTHLLRNIDEVKRSDDESSLVVHTMRHENGPSGLGNVNSNDTGHSSNDQPQGRSPAVERAETLARSPYSPALHGMEVSEQKSVYNPMARKISPSERGSVDRESFADRYQFIFQTLAVKELNDQRAEMAPIRKLITAPAVQNPTQDWRVPEEHMIQTRTDGQGPISEEQMDIDEEGSVRSPQTMERGTSFIMEQCAQNPIKELLQSHEPSAVTSTSGKGKGKEVEGISPVQDRAESVHSPTPDKNPELDNERMRLQSAKKKLEGQMRLLEEQQKTLDKRRRLEEMQRSHEEKDKRRQERKTLLEEQESEKASLIRKQKLERETLECSHKDVLARYADLDVEEGEVETDPRDGPWLRANGAGSRSSTSPTLGFRQTTKFLQQKEIDQLWEDPREKTEPATTAAPLPSLRRQSTQPAPTVHSRGASTTIQESLHPNGDSSANATASASASQAQPPLSISSTLPGPSKRPVYPRRNSIGVTRSGQVASLGTLFTPNGVKNEGEKGSSMGKSSSSNTVPTRKIFGEHSWTSSRPRLPFPGKYI
ncbi:hypothetical protein EJ08DRAFT_278487 [Tothia fuscella]|uniref:Uncharacterized protein n=1 Tax=Tothia fuscella TaxID=1048955 RepID=A0A9P4NQD6_9PEZI|nr:hypothetical protein EJ08DRAFT_278487 [Tothia fuscella]